MVAIGAVHQTRHILGLPGSIMALMAVVAGTLGGPAVGVAAALAGGAVYATTVASLGARGAWPATIVSIALWSATALVAAVVAETLRSRTEQLERASHYNRSLIEASLDALVTIGPDGTITDANQATEQVTGVPRERLIGTDFSDYFTSPDQARTGYQRVFNEGSVTDYPLAVRHTSGKVTDVLYNATVYRDGDGEVDGVFAAARDVSAQKRAQESLRLSEEKLRLAMEASQSGVLDIDVRAGMVTASADCQAMLGHEPVEVTESLDGYWTTDIHPDERAVTLAALEDVLEGRTPFFEQDHRLQARDGSWIWVHGKGSVVERDDEGKALRLLITRTDITMRKAAEAAAIESEQRFEEQRRIATALQENLVRPLPEVEGLQFGMVLETALKAALVGGDFSDAFFVDDEHVAVLIGDVAGKGLRAAGLTETVRSAVRAFAMIDASPAFVLRKANELLLRGHRSWPWTEFVTACLVVIDLRSGYAAYSSAGHPPLLHAGPFSCSFLDAVGGVPLGAFEGDYLDGHLTLALGDSLVFYTDGVTEARQGAELFGEERLKAAVTRLRHETPQALAEGVLAAAVSFAGELKDDLLVLALRFG